MNLNHGGPSASNDQPKSAAEIARKRVLAAYSSTVETLKNLPASARDALMNNKNHPNSPSDQQPQPTQPNWMQNDPSTPYQRTPIYTQSNDPNYSQNYIPDHNSYIQSTDAPDQYTQFYEQPVHESSVPAQTPSDAAALKDAPIDQAAISEEWQKYHSAWQDYYKNYYSDYYAKAAESYLATEKLKNERIATGEAKRSRNRRHFAPIFVLVFIILTALFLQYNRLFFAPIMAYVSPSSDPVATSLEAVDPTITQSVSPEPRLIIPKLNVDVPIAFDIPLSEVDAAMNRGVAHFAIPGASALPGQIGNLVITGHSAGDIYSSNPYKFIFSGLERLETGDLVYVNYNSTRYTYKITGRETVEPTDVAALTRATSKPLATLITCTPLGTSRYRLLVSAEQISPTYTNAEVAPSADQPSADGTIIPGDNTSDAMPANEPSFFENVWQGIFGN